jgi:CheY-like chemotaxis protein
MSPPTLLIGERDPFMRRALEQTLKDQFELRFADGGDDLVELARQQPPDLVITEAILPRRDGLQACRALKSDPATRHIPILCFTFLLIEERARLAGADAFLLKPLREEVLTETIHQLLRQKKE